MGLDRPFDSYQQFLGHIAGGAAQVVQDGGSRELHDAGQVLILQIFRGVQAAAGEQGELDAGGEQVAEAHLQIQLIQLFQKAVLRVIGEVCEMVPVGLPHHAPGRLHQLFTQVVFLQGAAPLFQRGQHRALMFLPQLPQVWLPRSAHRAGVRVVEQVFQMGPSTVLADDGNAGGPGLDPAVHGVIPQLHVRAGHRVRALGIDQKLVIVSIFI